MRVLSLLAFLVLAGCSAMQPQHRQLSVRGFINPEAQAALVTGRLNHQAVVTLDSAGGYYTPALAMAKAIYWADAETRVDGVCASACVLPFAAGKRRSMSPGSRIGIHGIIADVASDREEVQILMNLGMPPALIREMRDTPYWDVHWLTPAELDSWGVEVR